MATIKNVIFDGHNDKDNDKKIKDNVLRTKINFNKEVGKIKPMHASGLGPRQAISGTWDISHYFKAMNIPYSRLHDVEYPFGSGEFVDIHCIFPDFDADENDPNSYRFEATDKYLKAMIDVGCEPFYRLGESIDHGTRKNFIHPPKDFNKWARICEHIIRHYNEGWADGFHFGITYWEIWNEPDGVNKILGNEQKMWMGTNEEYLELYRITANHLKNCFGDTIKVGGPAVCNLNYLVSDNPSPFWTELFKFVGQFLDYVSAEETKAPLDFFSFHKYFNDPKELREYVVAIRKWLDEKGVSKDVEMILNEWNIGVVPNHHELYTSKYAADLAYVFLSCQKSPVDMLMYYYFSRVSNFNRVIGPDMEVFSRYFSFEMFGKLYKLGTEVDSGEYDPDTNIAVCAATNHKRGGVMVANITDDIKNLHFDFEGAENFSEYSVYLMDMAKSPTLPVVVKTGKAEEGLDIVLNGRESIMYIDFE